MAKNNKKLKDKNLKQLRKQKKRLDNKIERAEEGGKKKLAKKLRQRRKKVKNQISKKKEKRKDEVTYTVDDVLNSPEFSLLSPKQQEALKQAIELYDPGTAPEPLTDEELQLIADEAASIVDPYYDQQEEDITQDYEINLGNQLDATKTALERKEEDLEVALENGNTRVAEEIRAEIADLRTAIPNIETELQEYVAYKQEYLEREMSKYSDELATTLGRADEDEARSLRQREREYKNSLKQLRDVMASRGYAFSSERLEEEEEQAEEFEDIVSATKSEYERAREDAQKRYDYVTAVTQAETEFGLSERERGAQMRTLAELRGAESRLGTEQAQALAEELGVDPDMLVGELEGGILRGQRLDEELEKRMAERTIEDQIRGFAELYGTEQAQRLLNQGEGRTFSIPSLAKGLKDQPQKYTAPTGVTGVEPLGRERELRELGYSRASEKRNLEQTLESARTAGTYL